MLEDNIFDLGIGVGEDVGVFVDKSFLVGVIEPDAVAVGVGLDMISVGSGVCVGAGVGEGFSLELLLFPKKYEPPPIKSIKTTKPAINMINLLLEEDFLTLTSGG